MDDSVVAFGMAGGHATVPSAFCLQMGAGLARRGRVVGESLRLRLEVEAGPTQPAREGGLADLTGSEQGRRWLLLEGGPQLPFDESREHGSEYPEAIPDLQHSAPSRASPFSPRCTRLHGVRST
jgi:hypothetical protein